ncbi:hypothetical protein [Flavimaricola marinus]|uniref:Uncharacterized protein n=1 Tax=Flavimaricola marinus TaxID=1819565 RepID=A0A238LGD1_9RHOB|nr:hypothetical protein [Flavimaricola marinus]SMY08465.1 hypothetical protein LOM8899_02617 [Flavimaricola marinus]
MDTFEFKTSTSEYLKIGDIAGESQRAPETSDYLLIDDIPGESQYDVDAVWGTNGVALDVDAMHVDPVIPGYETDALTMPRVLGFEDPLLG